MIELQRHEIAKCAKNKQGKLCYQLVTGGLVDFDAVKIIDTIIHRCPNCQRKYINDREKAVANKFGQCLECECEKRYPLEEQNSEALAFLLSFNFKTVFRHGKYWTYDPLFNRYEVDHWFNKIRRIAC